MANKLDQEIRTVQPLADALKQIPELAKSKFVESVDVSLHLGVDPRKMMVRGVCHLPHGLGKSVKIAVFAESEDAKAATKAGANRVGMDDLAEEITADKCDYDVVIAHPNAMGLVGKLAKKLGPKGLMPNPKMGTVTKDVATAVTQALAGQAKFRLDKAGIIHCSIGRADFSANKLEENLMELLKSIKKHKPAASKGQYMQKLYLSTTMGKQSLPVDLSKLV